MEQKILNYSISLAFCLLLSLPLQAQNSDISAPPANTPPKKEKKEAKGNPWIFKEILHFFETGEEMPRPSLEEVVAMMLRHGQMMIDFKGEYIGVREMRKHVAWYTFGFPGAAKLREKVNHTETYEDLEELLQNYLKATNGRD